MGFLTEDRACRSFAEAENAGAPLLLVIEQAHAVTRTLQPLCAQLGLRIERVHADASLSNALSSRRPFAVACAANQEEGRILRVMAKYDRHLPMLFVATGDSSVSPSDTHDETEHGLTALRRVGRFPGIGDLAELVAMTRRNYRERLVQCEAMTDA